MSHVPVLLEETLKVLDPRPGEFFIDGTLDGGGHAIAVLERLGSNGLFLGLDWDETMIKGFQERIAKISNFQFPISKLILIKENYKNIPMILKKRKLNKADGLLLDLGFSSAQLEAGRGFSFSKDEPLLMTYSADSKPAYEWIGDLKEKELAKIINNFGEERFADRIARAIKKNLPIKTTARLAQVIKEAVPFRRSPLGKNYERGRLNPATRTFQALRIFVNQELDNLQTVLNQIPNILNPGGRVAVISFHSLEDRIVKNSFRALVGAGRAELINKKPVVASREESSNNPRSRSAKLRALRII
ncbi:MAG: Ribosomal RNA small subunit methyltransferase H [Candidatus Jorgensenbacteria bacterium GW2011_GWA1_48_11]|uniref:Ribosomal RNA small subunit methyltransferase H n=1 Tax=Candidatus Jorgensenbacteria bacterium GW2011_GWA1_48_11 TaxID=1618660 RepID=A0A0G1UAC1_9BACT|nr:MAG: Ribosomal RNA small subunit methyltransferase H [Candidatus Jorgensenbacteria bacterium GW2011_GWA1_48_11]KKW11797.1 MAG: Ribosomal RNA small subunit methyltransferase H [Candidatus Jorgensenbacteria bacterium GW2011_GWB1_49_9]